MGRPAVRVLRAVVAAAVLGLGLAFGTAAPAQAASQDVFDGFEVQATLNTDGTVDVVETITLVFGTSSGRHGLERTLITRAPDPDTGQDMLFPVTNISVESLTQGVSDQLDISYHDQGGPRNTYVRLRVGDPDRTIRQTSATWRLHYRIAGLLRTVDSVEQLYWNLTGSSMPRVQQFSAAIAVPGKAQEVTCQVATPGNKGACTSQKIDDQGRAVFTQDAIPTGQLLTVGVRLLPGAVTSATPIFAENAEAAEQRTGQALLLGSTGGAVLVAVGGWAYVRRRTGDLRYEGLPPGVLPAPGQPAVEVRNPKGYEVPVSFAPPRLSLAEAGLLVDGSGQVKHTTATLVGLAVNGAIKLRSEEPPEARLVDADRAPDKPSKALVKHLFGGGDVADLSEPGSMVKADAAVRKAAQRSADSGGWFLAPANGSTGSGLAMVVLVPIAGVAALMFFGGVAFNLWPLGVGLVATGLVVAFKLAKARRTGTGRALTDQVEGFRTYLATAEAEQLRFEEGEDIFSKYLPWAILFDLTERWTQVCEQLVAMGRLSAQPPTWYYGSYWDLHAMSWQLSAMSSHVTTAASPPPPSTSDSGWGSGGSAFSGGFGGGGGFAGGGGGGGGGGSW